MKLKISQATACSAHQLRITWANGKQTTVDASDYLKGPGYERLRDPNFFATVQVEEWGHGVEWPGADLGIPAEALYRLAREQSGNAFPTAEFNNWIKRNGLSLASAAKALHLTRRTIIYYSTGAKPIPAYIGLACKGWEASQATHVA